MAYRFVLEVPEADRKEAEVIVGAAPETQIVVSRLTYSDGVDNPYAALTIAAENVRVVGDIYGWMRNDRKQDARIVLLNGQRLSLLDRTPDDVVALIRTDQPWGERTVPRIGDHTEEKVMSDATQVENAVATAAPPAVEIEQVNLVSINVMDLRKAEAFYREFFGLEVIGRAHYDHDGKYRLLGGDYDWDRAIATETVADESFVRNGELILGLRRVGTGARLDRTNIDRISIQVDAASYRRLKAKVLVNSLELLGESQASFRFRDPFGGPWEITLAGLLPDILKRSLGA
ncbi:MAG: VOC family protein [Thermomicrobiales bacterium]|nr:VOC family protein [Thermomicrobiales bacterium]